MTDPRKPIVRGPSNDLTALLEEVYAAAARGDFAPMIEALDDRVQWKVLGSTSISKLYDGKTQLLGLFGALGDRLARGSFLAMRILPAAEEFVVVEGRGEAETKDGAPYNNTYCWVFRFRARKIIEANEYLDTELARHAFG